MKSSKIARLEKYLAKARANVVRYTNTLRKLKAAK